MASLPFTLSCLALFWAVMPLFPFMPMQNSSEPGSLCCLGYINSKEPIHEYWLVRDIRNNQGLSKIEIISLLHKRGLEVGWPELVCWFHGP